MSRPGENRPPQFEQIGAPRDVDGVTLIPGNIVDLNDSKYQLITPLAVVLERHPSHYELQEKYTDQYGNGETQDDALVAFREVVVAYRDDLAATPDTKLSSDLQGHKRFWVNALVPRFYE